MAFRLSVISNSATYQLSRSVIAVNEGSQVIVTLTTTGVQLGQQVPYTISGTGITLADFTGLASLSGSFTVGVDGVASIGFMLNADHALEGTETFRVTLNDTGAYIDVDVNDTSLPITYALSFNSYTVNEGGSVVVTLNTQSVDNGTVVPFTISGTGITASDFVPATLTGSFTVNNSTATATITAAADFTLEGPETFHFALDNGGAAADVTINDTSVPTYSLARSVTSVNEGSAVTITLTTVGVANGVTVPYTISGTGISTADFTGLASLSGSFTVNANTAAVTLTTSADMALEGTETMTLALNNGLASASVIINDTSATQPGETWTYRGTVTGASSLGPSIYFAGLYVIGDMAAAGNIFTSPDGVTWTNRGRPGTASGVGVNTLVSNGTKLIAGLSNGTISHTTDGINWTNVPGPNTALAAVASVWAGTQFIISYAGGTYSTSPDGVTWTNRGALGVWYTFIDRTIRSLAWTGQRVVACGDYNSKASSTNGISWSGDNYSIGAGGTLYHSVVVANGATVVMSNTSTGTICYSYDHGQTWAWLGNNPYTNNPGTSAGTFTNGLFILGGSAGALMTSTNGTTWTRFNNIGISPIRSIAGGGAVILANSATGVTTSP